MFRPSHPPDLSTLIICGDKHTLWFYPLRNFFYPSVNFPFLGSDGLLSIQDNSLPFLHTEPSDHLLSNNKSNGAFNYNQIMSGPITWLHNKTGEQLVSPFLRDDPQFDLAPGFTMQNRTRRLKLHETQILNKCLVNLAIRPATYMQVWPDSSYHSQRNPQYW